MTWDAFTIFEQFLIFVTIGSQMYIAIRVIARPCEQGAHRLLRFGTGWAPERTRGNSEIAEWAFFQGIGSSFLKSRPNL